MKGLKIDGNLYKIIIWDTAGQERFKSLPIKYYKNVDGVLLLYDVSDEASFDDVNSWIKDVKENANRNTETDLSLFLIANKIDTDERVVTKEDGEALAQKFKLKFFESSAKEKINVDEAFDENISLKEACVSLGFLKPEEFDKVFKPESMAFPK